MDMDCKTTADLATRILSGNGSSQDEADLRSHVAGCAPCAELERKLSRTWDLMGRLQPVVSTSPVPAMPRFTVLRSPLWRVGVAAAAILVVAAVAFSLFKPEPVKAPIAVHHPPEDPRPDQGEEENQLQNVLSKIEIEKPTAPAPVVETPPAEVVVEPVVNPKPEPKPVAPAPQPKDPPTKAPVPPTRPVEKIEPEVKPAPAPVAPKPVVIARIDRVEGEVFALADGKRVAAAPGHALVSGDGLGTAGKTGQAVVEFTDGTRLVLGADTVVDSIRIAEGKRVSLRQGVLAAQVARQPAEFPMVFMTSSAEARTGLSRLTMSVAPASTRIDVREGKVRATRREDGASIDVPGDYYVLVGKGLSLTPKPLTTIRVAMVETFERPRLGGIWNQGGDANQGIRITSESGSLSIKTAQKPNQEFGTGTKMEKGDVIGRAVGIAGLARKDWPRVAWIETRQAFPFTNEAPLRIRTRTWNSHNDVDRIAWIAINRGFSGQGLSLERRGASLQLWVEGAAAPVWTGEAKAVQEWETLELWVSKDRMVVRRNEETLYSGANPLKVKAGALSLGVHAKLELAQDEDVRFDDVDVVLTTKAELAEVAR